MEFTELLDRYGIPYKMQGQHHHATAGWVQLDCPFCSPDEEKYRLGYNIDKRYCVCWICGYCPAYGVIQMLTGIDNSKELIEIFRSLPEWATPSKEYERTNKELKMPCGVAELTVHHAKYLQERGKNWLQPWNEIATMWNICAIGTHGGMLRWRLWIPVYQGCIPVTWTTRAIGNKRPRYLNASDEESIVPISQTLYGVDFCINSVVIVEGPMDAWAIGPGAVALCGQAQTPQRLESLSKFAVRAICLDNEPDAQHRALQLQKDLSVFPGKTFNILLKSGKDPASAAKTELELIRRRFLM